MSHLKNLTKAAREKAEWQASLKPMPPVEPAGRATPERVAEVLGDAAAHRAALRDDYEQRQQEARVRWAKATGGAHDMGALRGAGLVSGGGWDESKHPRKPAGTEAGGEFKKKR